MDWESFEKQIREEAEKQGRSGEFTSSYLSYAKKLFDQNLPVIADAAHFSALVGLDKGYVCRMAYAQERFYRTFTIKKANGSDRRIDEPLPDLKMVQHWILDEILSKKEVSSYAKAYVKGKNVKHNARFHRAQKAVVTFDVRNFFPSIKIYDVYYIFRKMGYTENLSWFLANLCCLNKSLPQGAPTSPYLSNLRMKEFDRAAADFCAKKGWRYTRYADDLTFSGSKDTEELIHFVSRTVYKQGFVLNPAKTRVLRGNARQEVTGIVVNHHMQIPRADRRDIRQQIYYIRKYGLESHLEHVKEPRSNYLPHLLGQISFALFVNPKDMEMQEYREFLKNLYNQSSAESFPVI